MKIASVTSEKPVCMRVLPRERADCAPRMRVAGRSAASTSVEPRVRDNVHRVPARRFARTPARASHCVPR